MNAAHKGTNTKERMKQFSLENKVRGTNYIEEYILTLEQRNKLPCLCIYANNWEEI